MECILNFTKSLSWIALMIVTLGCTSEDPSNGTESQKPDDLDVVELEEIDDADLFPILVAEAYCQAGWTCPESHRETAESLDEEMQFFPGLGIRRFSSITECVEVLTKEIRNTSWPVAISRRDWMVLDEGRVPIDRSNIDDCRDALRTDYCGGRPVRSLEIKRCAGEVGFFQPQRDEGEPCGRDIDCIADLICESPDGKCYGTCTAPDSPQLAAQGEECGHEIDCEDGLICVASTENPISGTSEFFCEPIAQEGDPCGRHEDCEAHLYCVNSMCAAIDIRSEGQECGDTIAEVCEAGTRCEEIPDGHRCTPIGEPGDTCISSNDCRHDLYCDEDEICAALVAPGEPCDNHAMCAAGYCDDDSQHCEPHKSEGSSCNDQQECEYICEFPMYGINDGESSTGTCMGPFIPNHCEVPDP